MATNVPKLTYSIPQVCEALQISRTTLWKLVRSRRLKPVRISRPVLFRLKAVEEFLSSASLGPVRFDAPRLASCGARSLRPYEASRPAEKHRVFEFLRRKQSVDPLHHLQQRLIQPARAGCLRLIQKLRLRI